jgi:hypothetical protein
MKKITLLSLAFFALTAFNSSFAQVKDNAVKVNIVGAVIGQYQLAYERALTENISVQLSFGYISRKYDLSPVYISKTSGILIIPEVRYYFKESLKGAYGAAFFRYRGVSTDYDFLDDSFYNYDYEEKRTSIGGGLVLGYQALISDAVVFDIFLGPQFKSASYKATYADPNIDEDDYTNISFKGVESSGVGVRFGFNLGVAF